MSGLGISATLSHRSSAAANPLADEPGSQSAKRGCGRAFNQHGGPHPHAQSGLAAFSPFSGIRMSTGSLASRFAAPLSRCELSRTLSVRNNAGQNRVLWVQPGFLVEGIHLRQREAVRRPPSRKGLTAREACGHQARTRGEVGVLAARGPWRHRSAVRRRSFGFAMPQVDSLDGSALLLNVSRFHSQKCRSLRDEGKLTWI
jgi:hypothetical protein